MIEYVTVLLTSEEPCFLVLLWLYIETDEVKYQYMSDEFYLCI